MKEPMDAKHSAYFDKLSGMPVTHSWRGYGSAIFLEFGPLTAAVDRDGKPRVRRNGSPYNPLGEMEAMIESGWRVVRGGELVADSRSESLQIQRTLDELIGLTVVSAHATDGPIEIEITLSDGSSLTTFADDEPTSDWTIFDPCLSG